MEDKNNQRIYWQPPWIFVISAFFGFSVIFLFLPAGRIDWIKGWLYTISLFAYTVAAIIILKWVNPEIFAARRRIHPGTKSWDKVLLCFIMPSFFGVYVVAALDDGRFHWSQVPLWVVGFGYLLCGWGLFLLTWAEGVNRFFEPGVRVQSDRGHHVVERGPYAIVRHPGYGGMIIYFIGTACSLGSFLALVPAAMAAYLLMLRAVWEEKTLQEELAGYKEYCQRVRYRILPNVW